MGYKKSIFIFSNLPYYFTNRSQEWVYHVPVYVPQINLYLLLWEILLLPPKRFAPLQYLESYLSNEIHSSKLPGYDFIWGKISLKIRASRISYIN